MRILFAGGGTGGHLYPGLAIARALVQLDPAVHPFFVGARRGIEREVLPHSGFEHVLLDLHPFYRASPWQNWTTLAGLARSWSTIGRAVQSERPAVAVGTGGYASGPPLAYALAHRIPIVLQEQNSYPGLTTRALARFAREIYLGYAEAAGHLRSRAAAWMEETGNPIEPPPDVRPDVAQTRIRWGFPPSPEEGRVVLIFGGSQGARSLNDAVSRWLMSAFPERVFVIWGTGRSEYERLRHHATDRIRVLPYLSPIADAYAIADLALTRAGALTLAELCAWGIPAVLVPLPTAAADHQTANARALAASGGAVMLSQADLTVEHLERTLGSLLGDTGRLTELSRAASARARPRAAETIARRILTLAQFKQVGT
ncbi:MAG: UDP-N-acetylglucosamine--N-acetylmuramyl-(pentapeptide) pyrophosphoryl-undecaprenol N-acetylglucosamine transferase [Gemmatimonadaceae bacterium]